MTTALRTQVLTLEVSPQHFADGTTVSAYLAADVEADRWAGRAPTPAQLASATVEDRGRINDRASAPQRS